MPNPQNAEIPRWNVQPGTAGAYQALPQIRGRRTQIPITIRVGLASLRSKIRDGEDAAAIGKLGLGFDPLRAGGGGGKGEG